MDNRIIVYVESEEVTQGHLMIQNEVKFRVLEKKVHMTQLFDKALFKILVAVGKFYRVLSDGQDGLGRNHISVQKI